MISLDCESTGVDLYHGSRPFFVTTCDDEGNQKYWGPETGWEVDPFTREVKVVERDVRAIRTILEVAGCWGTDFPVEIAHRHKLVFQNPKFDATALSTLGISPFPWHQVYDTLLAGHLLASNLPHNLTDMAAQYLPLCPEADIQPYEDALEKACKKARQICRLKVFKQNYGEWAIAKADRTDMPSVKSKSGGKETEDRIWKNDSWLPYELWRRIPSVRQEYPGWETVLADYANADSAVTLALWNVMEGELKRRNLWDIYLVRLKLLPIAHKIEQRGITISAVRVRELEERYREESKSAETLCVNIASSFNYDLKLPKSGNNKSLTNFCFGEDIFDDDDNWVEKKRYLDLPVIKRTATNAPSLDKGSMDHYEMSLDPNTKQLSFVRAIQGKRKRDTAITYLDGYKRFWLPLNRDGYSSDEWFLLHPNVNPTGTDTLRWSFKTPNSANISKQENFNLRHAFGPAPGREWWSLDAKNIELRIPAYEAGEDEVVAVFDKPNDPPYYGSYHLVVFDALHPEMFAKYGKKCKDEFESTWYQWVKNGSFAIQYGAQEAKADATYHVKGAYRKLRSRFRKISALNDRYQAFARKHGYVETIPDRTVDPKRGYPLLCSRTQDGYIMPTTPFCYHVSGTAMWWMGMAMIRCEEQLQDWRDRGTTDAYIAMQVHDELVFDFPRGETIETNLPLVRRLQYLMESGGDGIGVPTPCSIEYNPETWASGIAV